MHILRPSLVSSPFPSPLLLLLLLLLLLPSLCTAATAPRFSDVTTQAGIELGEQPKLKYGGGLIADLDSDGHLDVVLSYHVGFFSVYFNNGNSTFTLSPFSFYADIHGISVIQSASSSTLFLSLGGAEGTSDAPPRAYSIDRVTREFTRVHENELLAVQGRGRVSQVLSDGILAVMNGKPKNSAYDSRHNFLLSIDQENSEESGMYQVFDADDSVYANDPNWWASVTDIDRDGRMELLRFHDFKVFSFLTPTSNKAPSHISHHVLSRRFTSARFGLAVVSAVAELDYDNDGWPDLYLARATVTHGHKYLNDRFDAYGPRDVLLRNIGGRYVDVSDDAGIPGSGTQSVGVTAGDFDNDGFTDLVVATAGERDSDMFLRNNGDGTFTVEQLRTEGGTRRDNVQSPGDMATAWDFDRDGTLDLLLSVGHHASHARAGHFHLLRNVATLDDEGLGNYLLVRVGRVPSGKGWPSVHAVVTVRAGRCNHGQRMTRWGRVGSPGTAVVVSVIDVVHFGLGVCRMVDSVEVKWGNGETQVVTEVNVNSIVEIGQF